MIRSILNSYTTTEIVIFGVGGMVVLTLAAVLVARRLFPRLSDGEFEPVADGLRVVYELLFALILAFVIAQVLDDIGNAESTVNAEATAISQLVRTNTAFADHDAARLDTALGEYVHAVAGDEFKAMKDGHSSPRAAAALEGAFVAYRDLRPTGDVRAEHYSRALDEFDEVVARRRERLSIATADLPAILRVLVIGGLVLLLVIEYRPRLARRSELWFMGTLAAVATSAFMLTVLLNYPFAGDISVGNAPFKQGNLAQFWSRELAFRPQPGDRQRRLSAAQLAGVWDSAAYGTVVMRCDGARRGRTRGRCAPGATRLRAVYRFNDGTVTGRICSDGVFRGWWSEQPSRRRRDAGRVVWRLFGTPDDEVVAGGWSYATRRNKLTPGWDLHRIGGDEPPDLAARFGRPSTFRHDPATRSRRA